MWHSKKGLPFDTLDPLFYEVKCFYVLPIWSPTVRSCVDAAKFYAVEATVSHCGDGREPAKTAQRRSILDE